MKILVLISAFILVGCAATGGQKQSNQEAEARWSKMDAALTSEIRTSIEKNPEKEITIFIQVEEDSDEYAETLTEAGFNLNGRVNTIWTGSGNAGVLQKLSLLDFITRMELNQKVKLHSGR